jgi:hypothetical protein
MAASAADSHTAKKEPITGERVISTDDRDDFMSEAFPMLDRQRLLEEVRARLFAITERLCDVTMDPGQLRTTTQELGAVAQRIEWLADISTCPPLDAC